MDSEELRYFTFSALYMGLGLGHLWLSWHWHNPYIPMKANVLILAGVKNPTTKCMDCWISCISFHASIKHCVEKYGDQTDGYFLQGLYMRVSLRQTAQALVASSSRWAILYSMYTSKFMCPLNNIFFQASDSFTSRKKLLIILHQRKWTLRSM